MEVKQWSKWVCSSKMSENEWLNWKNKIGVSLPKVVWAMFYLLFHYPRKLFITPENFSRPLKNSGWKTTYYFPYILSLWNGPFLGYVCEFSGYVPFSGTFFPSSLCTGGKEATWGRELRWVMGLDPWGTVEDLLRFYTCLNMFWTYYMISNDIIFILHHIILQYVYICTIKYVIYLYI